MALPAGSFGRTLGSTPTYNWIVPLLIGFGLGAVVGALLQRARSAMQPAPVPPKLPQSTDQAWR